MELFPSFGGAAFSPKSRKVIRLIRMGCVNRPFFHISVQEWNKETYEPVIEQIGNYDPLPNKYNEKLVAINFDRLEHWLRQGADTSLAVKKLLGLSGYFPVHPKTMKDAYRKRGQLLDTIKELRIEAAKFTAKAKETSEELSEESSSETSKDLSNQEESPSTVIGEHSSDDNSDGRDSKN